MIRPSPIIDAITARGARVVAIVEVNRRGRCRVLGSREFDEPGVWGLIIATILRTHIPNAYHEAGKNRSETALAVQQAWAARAERRPRPTLPLSAQRLRACCAIGVEDSGHNLVTIDANAVSELALWADILLNLVYGMAELYRGADPPWTLDDALAEVRWGINAELAHPGMEDRSLRTGADA